MKRAASGPTTDAEGRWKRRKLCAHNLLSMCLTASRRTALSAIWAAKLKLAAANTRGRRRPVTASWRHFLWLQFSYLHQGMRASAQLARRGAPAVFPPDSTGLECTHVSLPHSQMGSGPCSVPALGGSSSSPDSSQCNSLSTRPTAAGSGADGAKLVGGQTSSSHGRSGLSDRGVPSALDVVAAATPCLRALQDRKHSAQLVVARAPVGPATNMQELAARDLARLTRHGTWLNDEVVNFYMLLIQKRNDRLFLDAAESGPCCIDASCSQAANPSPPATPVGAPLAKQSGANIVPAPDTCFRSSRWLTYQDGQRSGTGSASAWPALRHKPCPAGSSGASTLGSTPPATVGPPHAPQPTRSAGAAAAVPTVRTASSSPDLRPAHHGARGGPPAVAPGSVSSSPAPGGCAAGAAPRRVPPRVYAFNSFFFTKLTAGGNRRRFEYDEVRRWTLPRRTHTADCVLSRDLLLVPINHGNTHWCLAAIWPHLRLLQYFDSLGGSSATAEWVLGVLLRWLLRDAEDKGVTFGPAVSDANAAPMSAVAMVAAPPAASATCGGTSRCMATAEPKSVASGWRKEAVAGQLPRQLDGSSCGVFTCAYAELLARGVPPEDFRFSQADIPSIRRGIAEQVLRTAL